MSHLCSSGVLSILLIRLHHCLPNSRLMQLFLLNLLAPTCARHPRGCRDRQDNIALPKPFVRGFHSQRTSSLYRPHPSSLNDAQFQPVVTTGRICLQRSPKHAKTGRFSGATSLLVRVSVMVESPPIYPCPNAWNL